MTGRIVDDRAISVSVHRARYTPIVSTVAGSLLATLPLIVNHPWLPPFGLLVLLSWRLLRQELWPVWVAFPFGLFDDLISGQALGTAATLWTICFILIDIVERRLIWRDYWIDWLIGAMAVALCLFGGWAWAAIAGSAINPAAILPQYALSLLFIPATMRVCAMLDHWRLRT